jgi:hypothetical protein
MIMSGSDCLEGCLFVRVLKGDKALIYVTSVHLDFMISLISGPAGEFPGDFDQVFF